MKIAVDFDGTIVENAYPGIGEERLFAFDTLKLLEKKGHQLILWTYRWGARLDEAVEFCRKNGIEFYAINSNFPEEEFDGKISRKIHVDIIIDDCILGGLPSWPDIYKIIHPEEVDKLEGVFIRKKKKFNLFSFFNGK